MAKKLRAFVPLILLFSCCALFRIPMETDTEPPQTPAALAIRPTQSPSFAQEPTAQLETVASIKTREASNSILTSTPVAGTESAVVNEFASVDVQSYTEHVNATLSYAQVTASTLNVREGPGTEFAVVDTLIYGDCIEVVDSQSGWLKVFLASGVQGWCSADYLNTVAQCTDATAALPRSDGAQEEPAPPASTVDQVLPSYVGQPLQVNAQTVQETYIHECFGSGLSELRVVSAYTPVQVLGRGKFVPPDSQKEQVGDGPFLKIRLWDGQVAWIQASTVNGDTTAWPEVSSVCEEYDTVDWDRIIQERPTPTPTLFIQPYTPPSQKTSPSCCKICKTGKACGNSCISRSYTCHKPPGCACNG